MQLNQAAIDSRRIPLDESSIKAYKPGVWQCHYCSTRFKVEVAFMNHRCKQKQRAEEIRSPTGQAAYSYYTEWLRLKKFKEQSIDAFMSSRYYTAFMKFAEFKVAANIDKPIRYIQIMHENKSTPDIWMHKDSYSRYIEWIDKCEDPEDQVASSISLLMDLAEKEGVAITDVMQHLGPQQLLQFIRQRKLSPWFLLHSKVFQDLIKPLEQEELRNFDRAINIGFWMERFEKNPQLRKHIRQLVKEFQL